MFLKTTKICLVTFFLWSFLTISVSASEVRLRSSKMNPKVGDQFTIELNIYSNEAINAVEGIIAFPEDVVTLVSVQDGNSSINFWVEKPSFQEPNHISFSGITPGGFSGVDNHLFSMIFEAKERGLAPIAINKLTALENDGVGTEVKLEHRNVVITVKEGDSSVQRERVEDVFLPESFSLNLGQSQFFADNQWFLVFATQDKDSGLSHFQLKEYRFKPLAFLTRWHKVDSPYILSDQKLKSSVTIRAYDNKGNYRQEELGPTHPLFWGEYLPYWSILIGVCVGFLYLLLKISVRKK